ncbi:hypothetical protein DFH08DRAFT_993776 [Mycena albidolilacea]|uniref:Uncharacterized protein n=1 Tax=Mycena albidolilacea TaxID=1033008 RepID=A0AAD6YY82_9AGAR|nr:hypothetical protein DFH08DRAFT_993776 [Mycena albidolilacea]
MRARISTSPAFTQYLSPNSQRSSEIQTAQAAVRNEIPEQRRFCCLRPGSSHRDLSGCPIHACQKSLARKAGTAEARGAYRLRIVRPLRARSRAITANAAGAGDGKPPRGVLRMGRAGRWGRPQSDTPGVMHVAFAIRGRSRFGAEGGVGAEDGRGARRGDEGGAGDGKRSLQLLRAPAMLRVVLPVPDRSWLGAEDSEALDTVTTGDNRAAGDGERLSLLRARGVVRAALRMRPAVVLAGDALGAGGGDKRGTGGGERPSRAQEVVKVVLGSTGGVGGDSSTLLKSHSVREGDEATAVGSSYRRGVEPVGVAGTVERGCGGSCALWWCFRWSPGQRAAMLVAAHVVCYTPASGRRQRGEGVGGSEEAQLCCMDGGVAKDGRKCELTPS